MTTEPERQVLIAHIELDEPVETPNNTHYTFYPQTLEAAASYYRGLRVDWAPGYAALQAAGMIEPGGAHGWTLTEAGRALARRERAAHPPIWYWYRELYPLMARSAAYSRFCQRLYGRDLAQAGFSDQAQIDHLLAVGGFGPTTRALDLGCGLGHVAEYLSDCSGARVTGMDYSPEAVELARARTADRRERLDFFEGNLDALDGSDPDSARWLAPGSYDRLISIDTLYMPADLSRTLRQMQALLVPGGQMLIYYSYFRFDPAEPRSLLSAEGSPLGQALAALGLPYQSWDFSAGVFQLMRDKHRLAQEMRAEFEAEGAHELLNNLLMESDPGDTPYDPAANNVSRILYLVSV